MHQQQEQQQEDKSGGVDDSEMLLNHAALELMHAIENKDSEAFLNSIQVLVMDIIDRMHMADEAHEQAEGEE